MCQVIVRKWSDLKSTYAAEMLKGEFPKCGVKYTGKHGQGLVLVKYNVTIEVARQKAVAAHNCISHVFVIPKRVAAVYGQNIPTLTDAV